MRLTPTERWEDQRVALFPLRVADVSEAYVGWMADDAVARFLESRFATHERAGIESYVAGLEDSERDLMLGIRDQQLDRHVGNIKLGPIDRRHGLGEIGIMIGDRAAWGRGIGTSAISLLAGIAFEELGLRKLSAGCYRSNVGSRKAFEAAGFTVEGIRPAHVLLDGNPEDVVLLGRLHPKPEYPNHA